MIALLIIPAFFILLALLRFRVFAEYGEDGARLTLKLWFVRIWFYPKPIKKKLKKAERKATKKAREEDKKPGRVREFFEILPAIKKALSILRRKLLIKKLTLYYTASGGNAAAAALSFGAANAAAGIIMPVLENSFKIKKLDIRMNADFESGESYIYINAVVSIVVWEAVYILLCAAITYGKKKQRKGRD